MVTLNSMRFLLTMAALGIGAFGVLILHQANTIFQEMNGLVVLLISAVLFSAATVIEAVVNARKKVVHQLIVMTKLLAVNARSRDEAANGSTPFVTPEEKVE